ncbi:hypothetical protein CRUP_031841 [Coryphaenoides rupestris]|nr:hypothetical protein CRUP_031841 [Coryphaenoides rupestris]
MAPPKKGKKVIHQDELRRLMREKQRQCTDKKKRVESPYAKYNSLGHLSCVLCNVQVKSELLWQTHVLGKQHKETVSELKSSSQQQQQGLPLKRKTQDPEPDSRGKKAKSTQGGSASAAPADVFKKPFASAAPADVFKKPSPKLTTPAQKSAGLSLLAGVYDEDEEEDDEVEGETSTEEKASGTTTTTTTNTDEAESESAAPTGLPDDFFDSALPAVSHSGSIMKADEPAERRGAERKGTTAEALPEGFFDDPVRDAKVRNVEAPQDLMDKEWDEFQKEIRQVNTKSDAIVAEDDEEGRIERQIEEIDEQIQCYRRVEVLRDRRDVVKSKSGVPEGNDEQEEANTEEQQEENEEELLDLLSRDWRAKGALA